MTETANPLAAIEEQHGFVFGNPDGDKGDNAPPVAALVCSSPTCGNRGQHVQIHADTVLPVHCGACTAVLHCDHAHETTTTGPTLDEPVEHTVTACTRCGTEKTRTSRDATPGELLGLLPAGLRTALKAL